MKRTIKVFEDEKLIYEKNLSVNMAILRGRLFKSPEKFGSAYHFTIKLSNGKNEASNEWRKPTYADCTAFNALGEKIFQNYNEDEEIFVVGKYYSNKKGDKVYKGFAVRDVIGLKANESSENNELTSDGDMPF